MISDERRELNQISTSAGKTLLITSSIDATSDLFVRRAREEVFRLNSDIMEEYKLELSTQGFRIQDPIGRSIELNQITAAYWRKPMGGLARMQSDTSDAAHEKEQRRHVCLDLAGICRDAGIWMLVDPWAESANTRSRQLRAAASLFRVPRWQISCGVRVAAETPSVVKALTATPFHDGTVLAVARIPSGSNLSAAHTWYVQDVVDATHDVTAVWCCGRVFAYSLDRSKLDGQVDWRVHPGAMSGDIPWCRWEVPTAMAEAIRLLMSRLNLNYGRLDFLIDRDRNWWFLEVNPNGQYAWLDLPGNDGLLDWVFGCAVRQPAAELVVSE